EANADMWHCQQGVHDFLRAYYHHKSADWPGNRPFPLASWTAAELAKMPTYYVMELDRGMAATVAPEKTSPSQIAANRRLAADVPACFIAGASDWGVHQKPGAFDAMQSRACTRMLACHLVDGAGHWIQQEQPAETVRLLTEFLARASAAD